MTRNRFFPRRSDDREDINPFNAGDPVMPLDDVVPTRDKRVGMVSRAEGPEEAGAQDPHAASATATKVRTEAKTAFKAKSKKRATDGRHVSHRPEAESVSDNDSDTEETTGHRRSIHGYSTTIGIIFLAALLLGVVANCGSMILTSIIGADVPLTEATGESDDDTEENDAAKARDDAEAEDRAVSDAATARLDNLFNDPATGDLIKRGLDRQLKTDFGYTANELGIDATAYEKWFLGTIDYRLNSAHSYGDGTGFAAFDVTSPDIYRLFNDFYTKVSDYVLSNGLYGAYGPDGVAVALTNDQKAQMSAYFNEVLSKAAVRDDGYLSAWLSKGNDGTWMVDDASLRETLTYLVGAA
ncbi:hypothetical protein [Collinsella aerofaciens]|uniref:hypothetical protein n=1 Tax=Collinsella aerofaciens TaxID=74426 RepID=UPI00126052B7|nr:hypothetical protein [Collinsella aerofaciens]VWL64392.1 Uncharacterised protein [Collinsella aerofaciens]VWL86660.1 Uncharacterised protein [Collinsella aerofaciens]